MSSKPHEKMRSARCGLGEPAPLAAEIDGVISRLVHDRIHAFENPQHRCGSCSQFIMGRTGSGLDQVTVQGGCPYMALPQPVSCWAKAVIKPFCSTRVASAAAIIVRTLFV